MIVTNVQGLRDPFMVTHNGVYYLYGTGVGISNSWDSTVWACLVNDSGSLNGEWKQTEKIVYEVPKNAVKQFWAPEVHRYKGSFYMISSYYSSETEHRGSSVLKSDSPTGPFKEISNGHVTPHDLDCIDATLYVDKEGQPWLVFVHEWTCTDDGVGRMAAAKLSDDLSRLVSEPTELFRADSPSWTNQRVTDGCFMYTTEQNEILMLWSNFTDDGNYSVGIAKSDNGRIDGNWKHQDSLLFTKKTGEKFDGGHGMIFKDLDGRLFLCLHSPNSPCVECRERTVLIPVCEKNGTLEIL